MIYVQRDDGAAWGPFATAEQAIKWSIQTLASDPDYNEDGYAAQPLEGGGYSDAKPKGWPSNPYTFMARHLLSHQPSGLDAVWDGLARALIKDVDWIIVNIDILVGDESEQVGFFPPDQLHDPDEA